MDLVDSKYSIACSFIWPSKRKNSMRKMADQLL